MHTIRLRGPWELEPLERFVLRDGKLSRSASDLPAAARCTMPSDWADAFGADFRGRVRYRRNFNKPTGLDSGERVWLVVEPPRSHGTVELNRKRVGEVSGDGGPARFDISEILALSNRLEIVVTHPPLDRLSTANDDNNFPGGLIGEVRLEIGD